MALKIEADVVRRDNYCICHHATLKVLIKCLVARLRLGKLFVWIEPSMR
jgi:hypothetical protein